jgi:hypothetical protein
MVNLLSPTLAIPQSKPWLGARPWACRSEARQAGKARAASGVTEEEALGVEPGHQPRREGMVQPGEVREGMTVRGSDGKRLGLVAAVGDEHFELEPGIVSIPRRDYLVEFRDVALVRGHDVFLEPWAHPVLEVDDDGGALPPRAHADLEREPVNEEAALPGP